MITQPLDIVGLAQARATDQTARWTLLSIIRPVIDKAIGVAHDDRYLLVAARVDILVGYDVINARLVINNILVHLN